MTMPGVPLRPKSRPSAYSRATGLLRTGLGLQRHAPLGARSVPRCDRPSTTPVRPWTSDSVFGPVRGIEEVAHTDSQTVVLGDLAVQLTAIRTVDVGEHRDGVLGIAAARTPASALSGIAPISSARAVAAARFGQIVVRREVDTDRRLNRVLAVRGHVRDVRRRGSARRCLAIGDAPQILRLARLGSLLASLGSRIGGASWARGSALTRLLRRKARTTEHGARPDAKQQHGWFSRP